MALTKIVSGGQTGVDRGALDAALAAGFPCGGWCPVDRRAEDGPIPDRYPLSALAGGREKDRTRQNVLDSDGTAILFHESLTGGTLVTRNLCVREKKPFVVLDASRITEAAAAAALSRLIEENAIEVLNVAGPRASGWPQGHGFAMRVVAQLLASGRTQRDK